MTTLREAAQQALEAICGAKLCEFNSMSSRHEMVRLMDEAITALRAALAEPVQEPEEFDHGIGADRFRVVRGAFWWHVLIGDSPTEHGKFRSRAGAEKMAADLLREFRNGAFVQHKAALAEPVTNQCGETCERAKLCAACAGALAQRKPLAEWQINDLIEDLNTVDEVHGWSFRQGVYAAEKHHGVKP